MGPVETKITSVKIHSQSNPGYRYTVSGPIGELIYQYAYKTVFSIIDNLIFNIGLY